ncbi:MAG: DUF1289 domain-containing protein [Pseudomonadota bacterium]
MTDDVWKRSEIESPCVKICVLHPDAKLCVGCYRTSEEIAQWSRYSAEQRAAIMAELPDRAPKLAQRRGGRTARRQRLSS